MARLKFEWLCNKTEIFSQWEIPCEGCDRSCEHLTKVSPYRGILGRNREFIFKRDGCCLICGNKKKLTIDHIKAIAKGGTNDLDNLQTLCGVCNGKKGTDEIDYRKNSAL